MILDKINSHEIIATPGEMAAAPSPQAAEPAYPESAHTTTAAIPIKPSHNHVKQEDQQTPLVPQSVPVPPHPQRGMHDEFGYINRHQRKTSIDEKPVRGPQSFPILSDAPFFISMSAPATCLASTITSYAHPTFVSGSSPSLDSLDHTGVHSVSRS